MRIESFDTVESTLRVSFEGGRSWETLGRLSSLMMVAFDCTIQSVEVAFQGEMPTRVRKAAERFAELNPVLRMDESQDDQAEENEFGYVVIRREEGFFCLRDATNEDKYYLFLSSIFENVDLAAKCAYIVANVLGFSNFFSYEVRFSVYELLNNAMEHGIDRGSHQWIQLTLERKNRKLEVSILDKGVAFDPTGNDNFDLDNYISSKKRRGLGLIMMRKLADHMEYSRRSGYNNVFFEKSMDNIRRISGLNKEDEMPQLVVGEPQPLQDGSYLISLEGDLDTKGALIMEDLLSQLLEQRMLKVVLDFEKVPFVSSAGVGMLLGMVNTLREEGGDVFFTNISPKVNSVFRLLNLDDFFSIIEPDRVSS